MGQWYDAQNYGLYNDFMKERHKQLSNLDLTQFLDIFSKDDMRRPERIPIVMKHMDWKKFIDHLLDANTSENNMKVIFDKLPSIEEQWIETPDLRLGQLLSNDGVTSSSKAMFIEEDIYMIESEMLEARDIKFWGVNYTKDMVKLPETEWRLIKDLETSHIEAILDGGYTGNQEYIGYFENELERRAEEQIHDDYISRK